MVKQPKNHFVLPESLLQKVLLMRTKNCYCTNLVSEHSSDPWRLGCACSDVSSCSCRLAAATAAGSSKRPLQLLPDPWHRRPKPEQVKARREKSRHRAWSETRCETSSRRTSRSCPRCPTKPGKRPIRCRMTGDLSCSWPSPSGSKPFRSCPDRGRGHGWVKSAGWRSPEQPDRSVRASRGWSRSRCSPAFEPRLLRRCGSWRGDRLNWSVRWKCCRRPTSGCRCPNPNPSVLSRQVWGLQPT